MKFLFLGFSIFGNKFYDFRTILDLENVLNSHFVLGKLKKNFLFSFVIAIMFGKIKNF